MERLSSHWMDFLNEILYLNIFFENLSKVHENRTLHEEQYTCLILSRSVLLRLRNTVCSTRYRTWHFFNNSNTNEDIATKFEQE